MPPRRPRDSKHAYYLCALEIRPLPARNSAELTQPHEHGASTRGMDGSGQQHASELSYDADLTVAEGKSPKIVNKARDNRSGQRGFRQRLQTLIEVAPSLLVLKSWDRLSYPRY